MRVVAGIDIGGTNTEIGLVTEEGDVVAQSKISTVEHQNAEAFFADLTRAVAELAADDAFELMGVGVGAPNGNYYSGAVESPPNLPWEGITPVTNRFDVPCFLTNDANAAAIGERLYGAAKGMRDFIVVTLGTGLGSGYVCNGQLIYGHDGFAGELGHMVIEPGGRLCGCGRHGCLETYASATGIVETARQMLIHYDDETVLADQDVTKLSGELITSAAVGGDALALKIFDETAKKLAFGLANTIAITSPEAIILFGGLSRAGDVLLDPLKRYTEEYTLNILKGKTKLLLSSLHERSAAVLGAAALAWTELKA